MESGHFAVLLAIDVFDPRISHAQKTVLAALSCYADEQGWCWPSVRTLAKRLGMEKSTVAGHLRGLEKLGIVETSRRWGDDGRSESNLYRLVRDRRLKAPNIGGSVQPTGGSVQPTGGSVQPTGRVGPADPNIPIEQKIKKGARERADELIEFLKEELSELAATERPDIDFPAKVAQWVDLNVSEKPDISNDSAFLRCRAYIRNAPKEKADAPATHRAPAEMQVADAAQEHAGTWGRLGAAFLNDYDQGSFNTYFCGMCLEHVEDRVWTISGRSDWFRNHVRDNYGSYLADTLSKITGAPADVRFVTRQKEAA